MTKEEAYNVMFTDYPDILSVDELCSLLEVGKKTTYKLLQEKKIEYLKIGREYRIPKINVLSYVLSNTT